MQYDTRRKALTAGLATLTLCLPLAGHSALVVTDLNQTVTDGSPLNIDLDGDGSDDFSIQVSAGSSSDGADLLEPFAGVNGGWISPLSTGNEFALDLDLVGDYVALMPEDSAADASWFNGSTGQGSVGSDGYFYFEGDGNWAVTGTVGYMALRIEEGGTGPTGGLTAPAFSPPSIGYHYGWLKVERGSLTVLSQGYNTTLGAPAPTATPAPGSLALMLIGGLALTRLRRKA